MHWSHNNRDVLDLRVHYNFAHRSALTSRMFKQKQRSFMIVSYEKQTDMCNFTETERLPTDRCWCDIADRPPTFFTQRFVSNFWVEPAGVMGSPNGFAVHGREGGSSLRCLWKRREVVLEQTVIQARPDLCFTPPHGCHPLLAINQVRTKVKPPMESTTPSMESATPHDAPPPHWCANPPAHCGVWQWLAAA